MFTTSSYKRFKYIRFFGIARRLHKHDAKFGHVTISPLKCLLSVVSIGFVEEALTIIPSCIEIRCSVFYKILEKNYFKFHVARDLMLCRIETLHNLQSFKFPVQFKVHQLISYAMMTSNLTNHVYLKITFPCKK